MSHGISSHQHGISHSSHKVSSGAQKHTHMLLTRDSQAVMIVSNPVEAARCMVAPCSSKVGYTAGAYDSCTCDGGMQLVLYSVMQLHACGLRVWHDWP